MRTRPRKGPRPGNANDVSSCRAPVLAILRTRTRVMREAQQLRETQTCVPLRRRMAACESHSGSRNARKWRAAILDPDVHAAGASFILLQV